MSWFNSDYRMERKLDLIIEQNRANHAILLQLVEGNRDVTKIRGALSKLKAADDSLIAAMTQTGGGTVPPPSHLLERGEVMSQLTDSVDALVARVAANSDAIQSAVTYIQGVPALVDAARQAALDAGATPATLTALSDLSAKLTADDSKIVAALTANTPTPPVVPGAGVDPNAPVPPLAKKKF